MKFFVTIKDNLAYYFAHIFLLSLRIDYFSTIKLDIS